jgi:hypothetical protein
MAKEFARKAGLAATESALESFMPQLIQRMEKLDATMGSLRQKVVDLKRQMLDRFEQTRDVINELGQRIARVEGKLEAYVETIRGQTQTMEKWIERVVQVEMVQNVRRKKAS